MARTFVWAAVGGSLAILAGILIVRRRRLAKKKFERKPGIVYLFQFSRPLPSLGPNLSPFCLKLETYLRMAKIPYESRRADAATAPKGKLPYIELDGEVIADSGFCVRFLRERFKVTLDKNLTDEQMAMGHAIVRMLEENTYWTMVHRRWIECADNFPYQFTTSPAWYVHWIVRSLRVMIRKQLFFQGTGRHAPQEILQIAESDLRALSHLLGHKQFMLGNEPASCDAAVFGQLAEFMWTLPGSAQETLIKNELVNLHVYCWRMRRLYWPDWETLRKPDC